MKRVIRGSTEWEKRWSFNDSLYKDNLVIEPMPDMNGNVSRWALIELKPNRNASYYHRDNTLGTYSSINDAKQAGDKYLAKPSKSRRK